MTLIPAGHFFSQHAQEDASIGLASFAIECRFNGTCRNDSKDQ
jgi:hypothetical protein